MDKLNSTKFNFKSEVARQNKIRPENTSFTRKNFGRLLEKEEEFQEEIVIVEEESTPPSPFELLAQVTKKTTKNSSFQEKIVSDQEQPINTDYFYLEEVPVEEIAVAKAPIEIFSKKEKSKNHEKAFSDQYSMPHPIHQAASFANFEKTIQKNKPTPGPVIDIVEQMVKSLQILEKKGHADAVFITLRYPPIFAEATLALIPLEDKREFNLSFANLKEEAKVFLDRKIVEDSLIETLARNDITIHLLSTSILPETSITLDIEQNLFAREEREQQRDRQTHDFEEQET